MTADRNWGFRTRAVHAGGRPEPVTGREPCRCSRRRASCSRTPPTPPTCSPCRSTATSTRASPTRRWPPSRSGWPASRAGSVPSPRRAGSRRSSSCSARCAAPATTSWRRRSCTAGRARCSRARWPASASRRRSCRRTIPAAYAAAVRPETKVVYTEIVANPSGAVADVAALADVAHAAGVPLVVDSTVATPYLCRPLSFGADIVVHSATKFLGGHGTTLGGVVVDSGRFDWGNGRFPEMTEPVRVVRRADVVGQLRRVRLLHPPARRAAARRRPDAVAVQRLPAAAGRRDAPAADGRPPGQRPRRRRSPRPPPRRVVGALGRPARSPGSRAGRSATCRSVLAPCSPSACAAVASAVAGSSSRVELCSHLANIGDVRTLVIHPGVDDAPAALRQRARRRRRAGRPDPHLRRDRGRRRHRVGPRPGARRGDEGGGVKDPTAQERLEILRATRSVAIVGMSTDPSRASYFVATYLLSSSCSFEHVWFVNPKGGETLGQPVYPSLDALPGVARPRRRVPPRRRPAGGRRGGRRHPGHPHVLGPARAALGEGGGDRLPTPAWRS